mmetsp:Transcript_32497/g.32226  ORF Transcript_32497/g.32226 Transcript_32497/m.32226 type:complete len:104 (+) Transcript_32497:166-477(+)
MLIETDYSSTAGCQAALLLLDSPQALLAPAMPLSTSGLKTLQTTGHSRNLRSALLSVPQTVHLEQWRPVRLALAHAEQQQQQQAEGCELLTHPPGCAGGRWRW